MSLVTYADLTAPSAVDAQVSVAARCSIRMKDAAMPMPPGSGVTVSASEISTFDAWVQAGAPMGSCSGPPASDPFSGPAKCSSNRYWSGEEGAGMDPGQACIACHVRSGEAPRFQIAGTVFPTGHEPDRCEATAAQGAEIQITGADGRVLTLTANSSGNFYSGSGVALPYNAKVLVGGQERAMSAAQSSGDCNGCHTQAGANGAPGRIALP